jgi:hypothetical protein
MPALARRTDDISGIAPQIAHGFRRSLRLVEGTGLHLAADQVLALLENDQIDEALNVANRTVEQNKNLAEAHTLRGFVLSEAGQQDEAIEACTRAIKINRNFAYAYLIRAVAFFLTGRDDRQVIAACRRAFRLDESLLFAQLLLGRMCLELGRYDEAITACNIIIDSADPNNILPRGIASAHAIRGHALVAAGRPGQGILAFIKSLSIDPSNEETEAALNTTIDELDKEGYHRSIMNDLAAIIKAAAELLSTVYPAEDVGRALENLAANNALNIAKRATVMPHFAVSAARVADLDSQVRLKPIPASFTIKPKPLKRSTTGERLLARFEDMKKINLLDPALSEDERVRLATHIRTTYQRLRKMVVDPEQLGGRDQLRVVERVLKARYGRRNKATLEPQPS